MKKQVVAGVLVATVALSMMLTACGNNNVEENSNEMAQNSEEGKEELFPAGGKLGFSTATLGSEFFYRLDESTRKLMEDNGYEMVTVSNEGNTATQIADIENLISMNCDSIVLFTVDNNAIADVCRKAISQGIEVYPISSWFEDKDTYTICMGTNEYDEGVAEAKMAAEWIEKTFPDAENGSIEVAVIGTSMTEDTQARTDGLTSITDYTSKAKVVEVFDAAAAMEPNIKSQEFADIIYSKYPDCKVVLTYADGYGLGVNEVYMKDSSLDREHFAIFVIGDSEAALQAIKDSKTNEGLIRGTLKPVPLDESIYKLVTGQMNDMADEKGYIRTSSKPAITAENIDDFLP